MSVKPHARRARFEHFSEPVLPRRQFLLRLGRHGGVAMLFLAFSMFLGIVGYHVVARLAWIDAFLNASMILTGMGPVSPMADAASKLFAGLYALYSGIAFLTAMGVLFAPILHRVLHRFHLGQ